MPVPGIHSIRNVAAFRAFENVDGEFTMTVNSLPSTRADEVVIKAISWNGLADDLHMYLVWSNLNNDIVGSFCGRGSSSSSPGTRIILNGVIPNQLHFKLMNPNPNGGERPPLQSSDVIGDICIHMDFITYQRTQ